MKHKPILASSIFALFASGGMALADVTAEQVWQNWQEIATLSGQMLKAGNQTHNGDTLTITDLEMSAVQENSSFQGTIPEIVFQEAGDGSVRITMSRSYGFTTTNKTADTPPVEMRMGIVTDGLAITASGDPKAIAYDYIAESVTVHLDSLKSKDKEVPLGVDFKLGGLSAQYKFMSGDQITVASNFVSKTAKLDFAFEDPKDKTKVDMTGSLTNLAGSSNGTLISSADQSDIAAMLAAGMSFAGGFTYDAGKLDGTALGKDGTALEYGASTRGGRLHFSMDKTNLAYGGEANGVETRVTGSGLPFPEVVVAYDTTSFELAMPLAQGDAPQDFTLSTVLRGLTVSDGIWGLFDPGKTLPRDPATAVIDINGKVSPLVSVADSDLEEKLQLGEVAKLDALNIQNVQLSLAGAEFKGSGALTFDNSKPAALGGIAAFPEGKISLSLTGMQGLLGKLQALGLVDPQAVMGFGMMSGLLAKPGPAPDSLTSEVEFKADGKILANGAPLPF